MVAETCQHHWIIETPEGPTSKGVCQNCHEVRDFENYREGKGPWNHNVKGLVNDNEN